MRIALALQYDGSCYHGWQRQPELKTVQGDLEKAIAEIAHHPIHVICAGRTDTGVHASGQIIHFDTTAKRDKSAWLYGVNSLLPHHIAVIWAQEMPEDFHARFKATARHYRYFLYNRSIRPAYLSRAVSWHYEALDHEAMHEAAQHLVGEHDFTSYRAVGCQSKSPHRNLQLFNVKRLGDMICMDIRADGFLHHMVRNMVGVLLQVGTRKQPVHWTREVLVARDRRAGGVTASPYGLYLAQVYYPENFGVPIFPLPEIQL